MPRYEKMEQAADAREFGTAEWVHAVTGGGNSVLDEWLGNVAPRIRKPAHASKGEGASIPKVDELKTGGDQVRVDLAKLGGSVGAVRTVVVELAEKVKNMETFLRSHGYDPATTYSSVGPEGETSSPEVSRAAGDIEMRVPGTATAADVKSNEQSLPGEPSDALADLPPKPKRQRRSGGRRKGTSPQP